MSSDMDRDKLSALEAKGKAIDGEFLMLEIPMNS